MAVLLGIDTGGTYTDAVLFKPKRGVLASAKVLTRRHDLTLGIEESVRRVLEAYGGWKSSWSRCPPPWPPTRS